MEEWSRQEALRWSVLSGFLAFLGCADLWAAGVVDVAALLAGIGGLIAVPIIMFREWERQSSGTADDQD